MLPGLGFWQAAVTGQWPEVAGVPSSQRADDGSRQNGRLCSTSSFLPLPEPGFTYHPDKGLRWWRDWPRRRGKWPRKGRLDLNGKAEASFPGSGANSEGPRPQSELEAKSPEWWTRAATSCHGEGGSTRCWDETGLQTRPVGLGGSWAQGVRCSAWASVPKSSGPFYWIISSFYVKFPCWNWLKNLQNTAQFKQNTCEDWQPAVPAWRGWAPTGALLLAPRGPVFSLQQCHTPTHRVAAGTAPDASLWYIVGQRLTSPYSSSLIYPCPGTRLTKRETDKPTCEGSASLETSTGLWNRVFSLSWDQCARPH